MIYHFTRQFSADMKKKYISLKPKDWANKTDINFMIFISIFVENYLQYDAIHDFSVWMRTGSNPADIYQFPMP